MIETTKEDGTPRRYRILSLDGGGVKGAYTAAVLNTLESLSGTLISDHFDLITGTSTGGIIAIGIGLGVPLRDILDLYVNEGPVIFPPPGRGILGKCSELWRHATRPKHSQEVLARALGNILGDKSFGASRNRLVIPAFNGLNGEIQLFKTAHCEAYRMDHRLPAKSVALATSAAPTYFSAFSSDEGHVYLDGGVWANCPAMVGLVEATTALRWPIEQIDLLSVGTTCQPFDVNEQRRKGGFLKWNLAVVDLLSVAQVKGTLGLASAMTAQRMVRIDTVARCGRFSLDGSKEVLDLKGLGENAARQHLEQISQQFFSTPARPFKPIHGQPQGDFITTTTAPAKESLRRRDQLLPASQELRP